MSHRVTFLPFNRNVEAFEGDTLLDVALREGIGLDHVCGGCCSCTTCHIVVQDGFETLEIPAEDEKERLGEVGRHLLPTSRLACQTVITGNLVVRVPGMHILHQNT